MARSRTRGRMHNLVDRQPCRRRPSGKNISKLIWRRLRETGPEHDRHAICRGQVRKEAAHEAEGTYKPYASLWNREYREAALAASRRLESWLRVNYCRDDIAGTPNVPAQGGGNPKLTCSKCVATRPSPRGHHRQDPCDVRDEQVERAMILLGGEMGEIGVPCWDTTAPSTDTPAMADEPDVTPDEDLDPDSSPPMSPKEAANGCLRVARHISGVRVRGSILGALNENH